MLANEFSAIITAVALIAAIASPIAVTLITNIHQDNVWKREHYTLRKSQVIDRYVESTGVFLKSKDKNALANYGNCYGLIFFYVSNDLWPFIIEIDKAILNAQVSEETQNAFTSLCKAFAAEAQKRKRHTIFENVLGLITGKKS